MKFVKVNRFYLSSKMCSCCETIKNDLRIQIDRVYTSDLVISFIELINAMDFYKFNKISDYVIISYIRKSLINKKIDLIRKRKNRRSEYIDIEFDSLSQSLNCIEEDVCFKEYIKTRLKGVQKKVIIFKYLKGYSDVEISKILNISRQAVNSAKNRAFRTIREDYMNII